MVALEEIRIHAGEVSRVLGVTVDLIEENGAIFVLLRRLRLPPGLFRVDATDVLFKADYQYPLSALDMFWTESDVVRPNGAIPQGADVIEYHIGRQWRRFSWHRNGKWNPASNGLLDHFAFVESAWRAEAKR